MKVIVLDNTVRPRVLMWWNGTCDTHSSFRVVVQYLREETGQSRRAGPWHGNAGANISMGYGVSSLGARRSWSCFQSISSCTGIVCMWRVYRYICLLSRLFSGTQNISTPQIYSQADSGYLRRLFVGCLPWLAWRRLTVFEGGWHPCMEMATQTCYVNLKIKVYLKDNDMEQCFHFALT